MRLLIAEDHASLGPDLKEGLEQCHYAVDLVTHGEDAFAMGLRISYDLIILDILLPAMSGLEICQQLRAHQRTMPILFLTALGEVHDRVRGLDVGADDYLAKPFAFRELEARVRAMLRRNSALKGPILRYLDIELDTRTQEVRRGTRLIALSSKEYALLEFFMRYPHEIVSRTTIAEHVWDYDAVHLSNVIDVYIGYLRNKLCANGEANVIQTMRSFGYMLKE